MAGVRILECATWGVAPIAATVLTDWGAECIKIEHPVTGDPVRGVFSQGHGSGRVDVAWEHVNRGKKGIGLDITKPQGQEVLYRLAARCDVFVTSFPQAKRLEFGIDIDRIRAANPKIVYARVTAYGPRGVDADKVGHDLHAYWARSGASWETQRNEAIEYAPVQPFGAFGDYQTGLTLAGGISAALFHRDRTGEAVVVDNSLFAQGVWAMGYAIIISPPGTERPGGGGHTKAINPTSTIYRTKDGRFVYLSLVQSDRWWPDFCSVLELPHLFDDPRFVDHVSRQANSEALIGILDDVFAARTYDEWLPILDRLKGPWSPVVKPSEVWSDPQVVANDYLSRLTASDGSEVTVVSVPVQFNASSPPLTRAPEHGEHTEQILLDSGFEWDEIQQLKDEIIVN
jgi:crotonobetainyl-CoA:carnitine CoA-transferase CaiB-like acyl-CoA transferase